jgi:hypothetical protein
VRSLERAASERGLWSVANAVRHLGRVTVFGHASGDPRLTTAYQEPEAGNRALTIWTAGAIGGGAVGALVGGLLTELSWRWIFFVNVPAGLVLALLAASRLPRGATHDGKLALDILGAVTVTGGLIALVWALVRTAPAGWGSSAVLGALALAAVLLVTFAVVETRASAPLDG